jgi:hypothetical protein
MKKLTLIVVSLLVTLFSYSQKDRIVKATSSTYKNEKWEVTETQYPVNQFVTIKDWDVTIGKFKLKTYGQYEKNVYEDHITYTWSATTQDDTDCYFMMKVFDPNVTSHIIYSVVYPPPTDYYYPIMHEFECETETTE